MLEVKVKKEDLQAKIQEELSKLESEWGGVLYEDTESVVVEDIERCRIINNECFRNTYGDSNDLEYEEFRCDNVSKKIHLKALLSAIKRKDKLINLSGMFNLVSDNSVGIDEGTYHFLYNEFGCEKPVYKPFKETKIYELLSKQVQERVIPDHNPIPNPPPPPPPVSIGIASIKDLAVSKQERQHLVWFLGTIIIALVLLLIYK